MWAVAGNNHTALCTIIANLQFRQTTCCVAGCTCIPQSAYAVAITSLNACLAP